MFRLNAVSSQTNIPVNRNPDTVVRASNLEQTLLSGWPASRRQF